MSLPVVDFSCYSLGLERSSVAAGDLDKLGSAIVDGLCNHNAIYIANHGFPKCLVDGLNNVSEAFFDLPLEVKHQYSRSKPDDAFGYTAPEVESVNSKRPPGYREAISFPTYVPKSENWPDKEIPVLKRTVVEFTCKTNVLLERFYEAMATGLGLKDKEFFKETHNMYTQENHTCVRINNYPPVLDDHELKPGQIRFGEHTDFGTITFIFQATAGGLEIFNRQGEWVPADPVEDAIIVFGGSMLQRYTNNKIIAAEHRVVFPKDSEGRQQPRRSIVFFSQPHDHVVVTPCNGEQPTYTPTDYMTAVKQIYFEGSYRFKE